MEASIDVLVALLRTHEHGGLGAEWTWVCAVQLVGQTAYLSGAARAPTIAEARAVKDALRAIGIREVAWERRNGPRARVTILRLKER